MHGANGASLSGTERGEAEGGVEGGGGAAGVITALSHHKRPTEHAPYVFLRLSGAYVL